ncbi:MAG: hypothetical protein AAFR96_00235 [Planctomycetota bacterium]
MNAAQPITTPNAVAPIQDLQSGSASSAAARTPSTPLTLTSWGLRLATAGIYGSFAFQKLPYHANTQAIFEGLGGHPAAIATAGLELAAAALLFVPRLLPVGAAMSVIAMLGALATHVLFIGVAVEFPGAGGSTESDGGALFGMAIATLAASAALLWIHRRQSVGMLSLVLGSGKSIVRRRGS